MSRYYNMTVMINGANPARIRGITAAANREWAFEDWDTRDDFLMASADDQLCGGQTEEDFVQRMAKAIWRANGGPCRIEVTATALEDPPRKSYCFDENDYRRIVGHRGSSKPARRAISGTGRDHRPEAPETSQGQ